MARNGLAWTKKWKSQTAKYYQSNPDAKKKKGEYDTKYHNTPSRIKYRWELAKANRKIWKKWDWKDISHTSNGKLILEKQSTNRARNWSWNNPTKKPVKLIKKIIKKIITKKK